MIFIKYEQYNLDSFVREYPAYMDIWTPKVGDENFCLKSENENEHNKFAIAIVLGKRRVGHVPKNLSKLFHQFMKIPNCTIGSKVTGNVLIVEQVMFLKFLFSTDLLVPKK